ncbi:MAG TPA: VOC family protein [Acidimicrobiales bacterium]|nr:VOC family protein [Acidimicrobiales bacterium]
MQGEALVGSLAAIRIFCDDLEAARDFYNVTLRLTETTSTPEWVSDDLGAADLVVDWARPDDDESDDLIGRLTGLSFRVDDAEAVCAELAAAGVEIVGQPERQPWGGTLAHIADPSANVLTLVQYPPS